MAKRKRIAAVAAPVAKAIAATVNEVLDEKKRDAAKELEELVKKDRADRFRKADEMLKACLQSIHEQFDAALLPVPQFTDDGRVSAKNVWVDTKGKK